ncbi:uncharacterized protein LOC101850828 [Aplysia californica]|uniref:Uncharacterized protein LOC101850828 n=1 Tax=Aplysia californica TaxID=6500 RepID=A0ABM1A5U7_APLCA|nr:uncharacterized protein LOC101850828 [Aplysia californica]
MAHKNLTDGLVSFDEHVSRLGYNARQTRVEHGMGVYNYYSNSNSSSGEGTTVRGMLELEAEKYLQDLNREFSSALLPAIVVLGILMTIGVFGNSLVLFVYCRRTEGGTVSRFIQALAVFDLLSCSVAIPGEIMDMKLNYTFGSSVSCPVVRTVNLFCIVASGSTLIVVAIDRYKRICCPLRPQISPRAAAAIIAVCAAASSALSLPSTALYGSRSVPTGVPQINGSDCSIADRFAETAVPLAYVSVQLFTFVVGAFILILLYSLIARRVFQHARSRQRRRSFANLNLKLDTALAIGLPSRLSPDSAQTTPSPYTSPVSPPVSFLSFSDEGGDTKFNSTPIYARREENSFCTQEEKAQPFLNQKSDTIKYCVYKKEEQASEDQIDSTYSDKLCENHDYKTSENETHPDISMDVARINESNACENCEYSRVDPYSNTEGEKMKSHSEATETSDEITTDESGTTSSGEVTDGFTSAKFTSAITGNLQEMGSKLIKDKPTNRALRTVSSNPCLPKVSTVGKTYRSLGHLSSLIIPTESTNSTQSTDSQDNHQKITRPEHLSSDFKEDSAFLLSSNQPLQPAKENINSMSLELPKRPKVIPYRNSLTLEFLPQFQRAQNRKFLFSSSSFGAGDKKLVSGWRSPDRPLSGDISNANIKAGVCRTRKRRPSLRGFRSLRKLNIRSEAPGALRTTLMFSLITLIYVTSFLPHLALMILKFANPELVSESSDAWELAQNLLIRSYFLNSVSNPIIYSFCSQNFFRECKNALRCGR